MKKLLLIFAIPLLIFNSVKAQLNTPFSLLDKVLSNQVKNIGYFPNLQNTDVVYLQNFGRVDMVFYTSSSVNASPGLLQGVVVKAGSAIYSNVAQLGGTAAGIFLNVKNLSGLANQADGFYSAIVRALGSLPTLPDGPSIDPACFKPAPPEIWNMEGNTVYLCDQYSFRVSTAQLTNTRAHTLNVDSKAAFGYINFPSSFSAACDASFNHGLGIGTTDVGNSLLNVATPVGKTAAMFSDDNGGNRLFISPKTGGAGYSYITQANDVGIFWSDGLAAGNKNSAAGLVIAPHKEANAGIRIAASGNVSINGNVSLGTGNEYSDYKLAVNGAIRAKRIKVETGWSDFVFDKTYKLKTLKEVEEYINVNHHLPEIPSASEVEANGADLGELVKLQMQKIEELTLYMIQQQKEIEALKKSK